MRRLGHSPWQSQRNLPCLVLKRPCFGLVFQGRIRKGCVLGKQVFERCLRARMTTSLINIWVLHTFKDASLSPEPVVGWAGIGYILYTIFLNSTTKLWRKERKGNYKTKERFLLWALDSVCFSFQWWSHDQPVLQDEALQTTVSLGPVARGHGSGILGPKAIVGDEIRAIVTTTVLVTSPCPLRPCFPVLKLYWHTAFW